MRKVLFHSCLLTAGVALGLSSLAGAQNPQPGQPQQAQPGQAQPGQPQQAQPGQARPGQAQQAQPGQAQPGQAQPAGKAQLDQAFAQKAAEGNAWETRLGQLGVERATNAEVRKFAQHMVDDHTKAGKEMMTANQNKQVDLPKEMRADHQETWNRLSKLGKGQDFDQAFMQQMVKDHQESVSLFQNQAQAGQDQQLKAFAAKTLPTLQEHLKMAQNLSGQLGQGGANKANAPGQGGTQPQGNPDSK